MIWLSWRQQRAETVITAGLLALLAVGLILSGIHIRDLFAQEGIARCFGRQTEVCRESIGIFSSQVGFVRSLVASGWLNLAPGLIGVTLAAPIILDLENGTVRLAWTQSITRRRWLTTKLALPIGVAVVAAAAYSTLFTWYQEPLDRLFGHWDTFGFEGIVPLAYMLFAFALALAIGALGRRSVAALVIAFGAYVPARLFVQSWLRQRLVTPLSATFGPNGAGPNVTRAWVVAEGPSNKAGRFFHGSSSLFQSCVRSHPYKAVGPNGGPGKPHIVSGPVASLDPGCMRRIGAGFTHLVYQPASHFWEIQALEFALFGGVALLLIAFASWRVLRTD